MKLQKGFVSETTIYHTTYRHLRCGMATLLCKSVVR